jgi:MoaA/NifB/PqqE/SkfB family radical SAM enzyme
LGDVNNQLIKGDLSFDRYQKFIVPYLSMFDWIYLQGWGEPLLHPNLWEMIALAQEHDCRVGFTTNGTLLRDSQIEKIIGMGIDMISISFAGASSVTHETLRRESHFNALVKRIGNLLKARDRAGSQKPWLELHYLMLQENIQELPGFVRMAADLGVDEVVATNLSYAPTLSLDEQRTFTTGSPADAWQDCVDRANQMAEELELQARIYPLEMEPTLVCDAQPLTSIFINHLGEVSPCVYLGMARNGQISRYFDGQPAPFKRLSFGQIEDGLDDVLHGARRTAFMQPFQARGKAASAGNRFLALLTGDPEISLPKPPEPCRNCYKLYGI